MRRPTGHVATLYKHLRFTCVTVLTLAKGEISEFHVGLEGTRNALFLKDLAAKTHRGFRGPGGTGPIRRRALLRLRSGL